MCPRQLKLWCRNRRRLEEDSPLPDQISLGSQIPTVPIEEVWAARSPGTSQVQRVAPHKLLGAWAHLVA